MSGLFSSVPPPKAPAPPTVDTKAVQDAAAAQAAKRRQAQGYRSTILSDMYTAGLKAKTGE